MKHVKKIFAFAVALFMALAVALPAYAEGEGTITINTPTDPAPTGDTTYKIYKVFEATSDGQSDAIAYKLKAGKTLSGSIADFFKVDNAGNVEVKSDVVYQEGANKGKFKDEAAAAAAIKAYVNENDLVDTVTVSKGQTSGTSKNIGYGYFFIDTSTGTIAAVTSTNPQATVNDKNVLTTVDKTLANGEYNAIAEDGGSETFTGKITLGKGANNVKYHDTMTNMTYNGDLVVTVGGQTVATDNYTVTPKADNKGFDVAFNDAYTQDLAVGTVITLTYSGTITTDAYDNPAINQATVTTGNKDENEQKPGQDVKVYTAQIGVQKSFSDNQAHVDGAGFVLYKMDGQTKKYYKFADNKVTWVDNIASADEHKNAQDGKVAPFVGLDNGAYYLEEKTVPDGFNKANDIEITIQDKDYTASNLNKTQRVVNEQGTVMPSTGGIGTTIFYIVGGVMVAGAAIFLLTKRRAASAE